MTIELSWQSVSVPNSTIRYVDMGEGPPVLLVHGAPMTAAAFLRVIHALVDRGFRVLAPDLPGFGGSVRGAGFGGDLGSFAAALRSFVEALDLRDLTVYLNDSSGCIGVVALDGLEGRLRGLVVADTVPLPLTGWVTPVRWVLAAISSRPMRWVNRTLGLLPWLVVTVAPLLRPFSRDQRRALLSYWRGDQFDHVLDVFGGMARDRAFMTRAAASARALSDVPALILFGQLDPMRLVGGVRFWRSCFGRSETVIIPWEEHFPILASGEQVGGIVADWAGRLEPT